MKYSKTLFSLFIVVTLVVSISGCSESESGYTTTQTTKTSTPTITTPTETYTPKTWTMINKDYTFDRRWYTQFELDKTTKLTITLKFPADKHLDYIGVIPETELEQWKNDDTASEYLYLKKDVESGTYRTTLNAGKYIFVIGLPTPEYQTLKEDTVVIKAGDYETIPLYLNNILYAQNMKLTIEIREDSDINVMLLREKEYNIWKQGGTPRVIAYIKKATSGTYYIEKQPPSYWNYFAPNTYYLILDNRLSLLTDKTVDYIIEAEISQPFTGHIKIVAKEEG